MQAWGQAPGCVLSSWSSPDSTNKVQKAGIQTQGLGSPLASHMDPSESGCSTWPSSVLTHLGAQCSEECLGPAPTWGTPEETLRTVAPLRDASFV